jgi:hypothetical protein
VLNSIMCTYSGTRAYKPSQESEIQTDSILLFTVGFEPTSLRHQILNPMSLPISPSKRYLIS